MAAAAKQPSTGRGRSKNWLGYHAKWPNSWAVAVANLDLSGAEARVLIYVVARTWGEYDARRQRFGRACARLSSSEVGAAINMDASGVRRARASLVKRGALQEFRPPAGRRATSIGPGPLLHALTSDQDKDDAQSQTLDDAFESLSPKLRAAAIRGRTIIENAEA